MTNTPTSTTASDLVTAAMSIADDAAQGRLDPVALEAQAAAELRQLFGTVVGEGDPAWPLQVDVCRQVLALDGIPADELAEWLAVARHRAGEPVSAPEQPGVAEAEQPVVAELEQPAVSEPEQPVVAGREPVADGDPQLAPQCRADGYDPLAGWSPGRSLRLLNRRLETLVVRHHCAAIEAVILALVASLKSCLVSK